MKSTTNPDPLRNPTSLTVSTNSHGMFWGQQGPNEPSSEDLKRLRASFSHLSAAVTTIILSNRPPFSY